MPQDPAQRPTDIGPGGWQQPAPGQSYAERQYEAQAYEAGAATGRDAGTLGAALEQSFARIPDVRKARYQGLQDALREYAKREQDAFNVNVTRAGLKGPLERARAAPSFGASLLASAGPGLAGVADTVGDFLTGGESGILEATYGGATTLEEARRNARRGIQQRTSGYTERDRQAILQQIEDDKAREEQGLPRVLSDEDLAALKAADSDGALGIAGDVAELIALTPGRAVSGIATGVKALGGAVLPAAVQGSRVAGFLGRAGAEAIGQGVVGGVAGGLRANDLETGIHDAKFSAGMGALSPGIGQALDSRKVQQLLAASQIARSRPGRWVGRTAAEVAKIQAGRLAAGDPINAETLAGDTLAGGFFALGTGRSMAGVNRRIAAKPAGDALQRAGKNQREARETMRGVREAYDIATEAEGRAAKEIARRETIDKTRARLERDRSEKEYQARLEERTQARLQELGAEIQRNLDNKETRDFQEATRELRAKMDRMDREVAAEQAKAAEDQALNRRIEQEGELRQLQARREAAARAKEPGRPEDPADTLKTLAGLETAPRTAETPRAATPKAPLTRAEIEWAKKTQADVEATGRTLTKAERRKIVEMGQRNAANQSKADVPIVPAAEPVAPSGKPAPSVPSAKPETPAAVGGTAAPAKPGRKPRAITPQEQEWARQMVVQNRKLTPAERKKLTRLQERVAKSKEYEAAQQAEAQRQQEAAASPDPRARLSDKGRSMVDQYVDAIQKPMDAKTYKGLREQFVKKIRQAAKWNDATSKTTNENRVSETSKLMEYLDREAPEHIKKHNLNESQLVKEFELRKALKEAKKSGDARAEAQIRQELRGLKRASSEIKVDRRAANREQKITREEAESQTPPDEAAIAEAITKSEEIRALGDEIDPKALESFLRENAAAIEADVRAGNVDAVMDVMRTLPKRDRSGEAGFAINGGPLGQLAQGLYQLLRRGVTDFARFARWASQMFPGIGKKTRDFFARIVSNFGARSIARKTANYHVGQAHDAFVNLTPEGPAKEAAKKYVQQHMQVAEVARASFEKQVYKPYAKAITEAGKELASKATESVHANGSEWHRLEAELLGYIPPSAELAPLREAYKRYAAETWNVSDALGLTHPSLRGKKVDPNGPGYLLQPLSVEMRAEIGLPYETARMKALRDHLKKMPENRNLKPEEIDEAFELARKANSNDTAARTSSEKKNAIEFVRRITWPGRFQGIDVTVAKPFDVIRMHHRGLAHRVGFEKAFGGRELKDMRKEFADLGGDPTRFDRFIEASQGQNPRYSDWISEKIAENPGMYEASRVMKALMRLDNTLDLSMSAVSAASDFMAGPGANIFGRRYYREAAKAAYRQAKLVTGLDQRTAAEIATSAQELHMRVSDFSQNRNLRYGGKAEEWSDIASQHIANVLFRHINRGTETVISESFLSLADDIAKASNAGKRIRNRDAKAIDRVARHLSWDAATKQRFATGKMSNAEVKANIERLVADLTGQTQNPMFRSAAQKNPLLRYLVRFASHATQQQRLTIRAVKEWANGIASAQGTEAKLKAFGFESMELGKFLGQKLAQGAALVMMKALLQGDNVNPWSEDSRLWAKVRNDPLSGVLGMIADSLWASAVLGPYAMALSGLTGADSPIIEATSSISPTAGAVGHLTAQTGLGQFVDGMINFWANPVGPYRDTGDPTTSVAGIPVPNPTTMLERLGVMVTKRIPGTRNATNLAVMAGLAAGNKDLDNASSALYRWRQDNGRITNLPPEQAPEPEHAAMRRELRDALKEMASGRSPGEGFARALEGKKDDAGKLAAALRSRMQLTPQRGITRAKKRGEPETDLEAIRKEMGDEQFRTLVLHDELLNAWADFLVDSKGFVAKTEAQVKRQTERLKPLIEKPETEKRIRAKATAAAEKTLSKLR